jgi:hypothetical protein
MTAEPAPTYEPAICGHRETRTDGTYECVARPGHEKTEPHVWIKLVRTVAQ